MLAITCTALQNLVGFVTVPEDLDPALMHLGDTDRVRKALAPAHAMAAMDDTIVPGLRDAVARDPAIRVCYGLRRLRTP